MKVVIALGKIAFDGYLKFVRADLCVCPIKKKDFKFFHGATYRSKNLPHVLIASYHPSRQNTNTGRLTPKMFKDIFKNAIEYCNEIH